MTDRDLATAADVARKLLAFYAGDASRWTQGSRARDANGSGVPWNSPKAVCWCDAGARLAVGCDDEECAAYVTVFRQAFGGVSAMRWNDDDIRTFKDVVAALERIAALSPATTKDGA